MTDNEQAYTPTTQQVRDAVLVGGKPFDQIIEVDDPVEGYSIYDQYVEPGAAFDRWLAATLAAHRVTLVADSREALAEVIKPFVLSPACCTGYDWPSEGHDANPPCRTTILRAELIDALLASGVVQVTTPTETDERIEKIEKLLATEFNGVTWWDWIEDGLGGSLHDELRAVLASRPAPVAPPTEEVEQTKPDPLGAKSPDDCTHWKVGRSFGSTHGVCHSCGSQIEYDEVSPLSIIEVKPPVVPVDALGFPTQDGASFTARFDGSPHRSAFRVSRGQVWSVASGNLWPKSKIDHTSIEDVRPADGRNGQ